MKRFYCEARVPRGLPPLYFSERRKLEGAMQRSNLQAVLGLHETPQSSSPASSVKWAPLPTHGMAYIG